jgi:hypothetical protein
MDYLNAPLENITHRNKLVQMNPLQTRVRNTAGESVLRYLRKRVDPARKQNSPHSTFEIFVSSPLPK